MSIDKKQRRKRRRTVVRTDPLGVLLDSRAETDDVSPSSLLVGTSNTDPYNIGTDLTKERAQWFATTFREFNASRFGDPIKHVRGMHYALLGQQLPSVLIGAMHSDIYHGSRAQWGEIMTMARNARWLGYIGWDELEDRKHDDPELVETTQEPEPFVYSMRVRDIVESAGWLR